MIIRPAIANDAAAIRAVNESAFGRPDEADLVDRLRIDGAVILSLVAERNGAVAGHILFSRMWIDCEPGPVAAVALAPVAVLPKDQNRGVGSALIRNGLDGLQGLGESIVLVLGHPEYYSRFGFSAEAASRLESPFPPDSFMAKELRAGALAGIRGKVRYPAAFGL